MSPAPTLDLRLRPWREADAEALRDAIDEDLDHLRPWVSWSLEEPATLERTRERIRGWMADHGAGRERRFAIVPAHEPDRVLGGVWIKTRGGVPDLGYFVRKSAARQGIASAAAAALVVVAFHDPDLERLALHCDTTNAASAGFARALGFEPIGRGETTYPDGTPRPVLRFELTRERFEEVASDLEDRAGRVSCPPLADATRP